MNWKLPVPTNPSASMNTTSMVLDVSEPSMNSTVSPMTVPTMSQPTFGSGTPVRCRVKVTAVSIVVLVPYDTAVN